MKRMKMRSMRRGTKEMDLILGGWSDAHLAVLSGEDLDAYEALLGENDHDLYQWVTGQAETPAEHAALIARISAFAHDAAGR